MIATLFAWRRAAPTAWSARKGDEPTKARGEPAQRGADDEDAEPIDVEQLATPRVGEAADGHHGGDQDE
jgi:hypothetical protein